VFWDYIGEMPESAAALTELYESGQLTTEQMAMLGASLEDLKTVFDPLLEAEKNLADATLELSLIMLELEEGPEAALAERRRLELEALDASLQPMQERIWALEDEQAALEALAEAAAAAQEMMLAAQIQIEDLQDPEGALGRERERILAEAIIGQSAESAAALAALYSELWLLEDAALAAAAAAEALEQRVGLEMRLLELVGSSAEILAAQRELEKADTDPSNHALLELIWLIEDAAVAMENAINSEYDSTIASIAAQEEAARASHDATLAMLDAQREVAQESLNVIQGVVSTIQSALSGMRGQEAFSAGRYSSASAQLSSWATSGTLPEADALDRVLATLGQGTEAEFATEAQWRAAQATTFAALLALESTGLKEVSWAEQQVAAIDAQSAAASSWHDAEMAAYAQAREQAAAWRDDQLAGMASQLQALTELPPALAAVIAASPVPTVTLNEEGLVAFTTNTAATTEQTEALQAIKEELALLRKDMAVIGNAQLVPVQSIESTLTRWNLDGLPATSEDESGEIITLLQVA
jgi:hypothetical protein